MASALREPFAIYPMVEEHEAQGQVAATYAAVLQRMPFVPSLFKSLALCPPYLVLAWDQASQALAGDELAPAAQRLISTARAGATPVSDHDVRRALREFVGPLGRMLVLSAGLLGALEDDIGGPPASARSGPAADVKPSRPVASQWEAGAYVEFGEIRRALDTPIVNSIWRSLAEKGLITRAWTALAPQADATRTTAAGIQARAVAEAEALTWPVVASPAALDAAGITDAAPAIATILDAYIKTLARLLALVAANDEQ